MVKRVYHKIGKRFGSLVVINETPQKREGVQGIYWQCQCDCNAVIWANSLELSRGSRRTCGAKIHNQRFLKHGNCTDYTRSNEYSSWLHMRERCLNSQVPDYSEYGAKGITICSRWANDFSAFLKDMGEKPSKHHTLGRIDNSQGYTPSNVRWESPRQQNLNKKNNRLVKINGVTKPLTEWCEIYARSRKTVYTRCRRGWKLEEAITTPTK